MDEMGCGLRICEVGFERRGVKGQVAFVGFSVYLILEALG